MFYINQKSWTSPVAGSVVSSPTATEMHWSLAINTDLIYVVIIITGIQRMTSETTVTPYYTFLLL